VDEGRERTTGGLSPMGTPPPDARGGPQWGGSVWTGRGGAGGISGGWRGILGRDFRAGFWHKPRNQGGLETTPVSVVVSLGSGFGV